MRERRVVADLTVENLEINVKTNAGDSAKAFKSLKSALQGVSGASVKLTSASNGVRQIGAEAKKAEKHTNKLLSSIKRIAMYRLLRSVIKEITQAFSEGLKAAYAFSAGLTTEGNRFAAALDNMKSATNQMKGQLGSALAGLLTAIAPILERIINLIVKVADVISQFFAAFTGSTYLKAIRTQAEFADITAKGAKSAKEWKNQLLGFDEINKLNEPSSGGGTGVNLLEGYAFEDAPISEGIRNFVEKIKQKFAELKESIDFTNLKKSFSRLKESIGPLVDIISKGLSWAWNNVLLPFGKWTIEEAAPALVDALAAAFEFLSAVFDALAPVLEPLWENVLKPFFEACGEIILTGLQELTDLLKDLTDLIKGNIGWDEFIGGLDGVQIALLALGGTLVLSAIGKITTAIAGLPAVIGTATAGMTTGLAAMAKSAFVGALAVVDAVLVAYDVKKIKEASNTYKEAQQAHTRETQTALNEYTRIYNAKGKEIADQWAKTAYNIDTTGMDFEQSQLALTQKIEGYWEDVPQNLWQGFKAGWNDYFGSNGKGAGQLMEDAFTGAVDGVKDTLGIHSPSTVFESIGENSVNGFLKGFSDAWNRFMTELRSKLAAFRNAVQQGLSFGSASVRLPSYTPSAVSANLYADGGFPTAGELFIANERGPELVGSLNGQSAVANNGQIEAGIEEAAYRGFVRAIASSGGGNNGGDVVLNINGREFARATYKDYQAAARETGGSLINNFA